MRRNALDDCSSDWHRWCVSPGELIRAARERSKLSLRAASRKSGIHTSVLHRIEHNRQDARSPQLKALALAYETTVAELVGEADAEGGESATL